MAIICIRTYFWHNIMTPTPYSLTTLSTKWNYKTDLDYFLGHKGQNYQLAPLVPTRPFALTRTTHTNSPIRTNSTTRTNMHHSPTIIGQIIILDWSLFPMDLYRRWTYVFWGGHQIVIYLFCYIINKTIQSVSAN